MLRSRGSIAEGTRGHGDMGRRERQRRSAKVQIGAELLCKGAKVRCRARARARAGASNTIEIHRFGWQVAGPGGGWREETIFGSRVSVDQVSGSGSSGAGTGTGPEPVPGAEYLNQIPDGRDLGPENALPNRQPLSANRQHLSAAPLCPFTLLALSPEMGRDVLQPAEF